jgi:hypothetical protein
MNMVMQRPTIAPTTGSCWDSDAISAGRKISMLKELQRERKMRVDTLILRSLFCCRSAKQL